MSLVFRNALMPSENQQVLRLRLSDSINENKNNPKNCWISSLVIGCTANKPVNFSIDIIAPSVSAETLLFIRGTADVVAATNVGIGFLLIISSSIRDHESAKKVLLGELVLMSCLIIVAIFNTLNAGVIVDAGPPPPFWVVLIANPVLCTYGLLKGK